MTTIQTTIVFPMKNTSSCFTKLTSSLWPTVGAGCVLAFSSLFFFYDSVYTEIYTASQSQATDPIESKTGELNQAEPGGPVKITAQEAIDDKM